MHFSGNVMRFGPQEIILVVLFIITVIMITFIARIGRSSTRRKYTPSEATMIKEFRQHMNRLYGFFKETGIALAGIGIILILSGLIAFKWTVPGYMWSFIIIVIGSIMLFMFRKKL
jgi:hypothetical protein